MTFARRSRRDLKQCLVLLRGVTALTRAVSGKKQINSGNLEILPGTAGNLGSFSGNMRYFGTFGDNFNLAKLSSETSIAVPPPKLL